MEISTHTTFTTDDSERLAQVLTFARENKHSDFYSALPQVGSDAFMTLRSIPPLTWSRIAAYSKPISHYPEEETRVLTSYFTSTDEHPLVLLPQRVDALWKSVLYSLRTQKPPVDVLIAPMFWQIGPMFYRTCREARIPAAMLSPRNLPVARQVLRETNGTSVVTTPEIATALSILLREEGLLEQVRTWRLISSVSTPFSVPTLLGDVTLEYHAFPGVSIGSVPNPLGPISSRVFLPNPDYLLEVEKHACYVTSLECEAFPLIRFEVPAFLKAVERRGETALRLTV